MPAVAELRVLYVGHESDLERELLRGLPVRVTVTDRLEDIFDDEIDIVVATEPLPAGLADSFAKPLVVLGQGSVESPEVISLPREPLSVEILELAMRAALDRRTSRDKDRRALAQRHFKRIFEASPVGIALTSVDGIVLAVNPALTTLLGFDARELIGKPAATFTDAGENGTTHRSLFQRMRGTSITVRRERRLKRRDGGIVHAEVSTSMLREDDGVPVALLQTFVDVSSRKEAEERLAAEAMNRHLAWEETQKAHEFLDATLCNMPVGVLVVELPAGKTILANKPFREMCDEGPGEPSRIDATLGALRVLREDGTPYPADELPLARTLATGAPHVAADIWIERKNGLRVPIAARSAPIEYQGRAAAVLTLQDITEVREQERARRTAEGLYRRLFEHSTDAILIVTPDDFKIVEANPAAAKLLRPRPELLGSRLPSFSIDLEGQPAPDFAEQRALARSEGLVRFAWRAARKVSGAVDFDVSMQPLPVEGGAELFLIRARDVTRQRVLEDELRQSQKLEAIGVLAGGVAHDYNNLLTGVIGFLELALDKLPQDPQHERVRKYVGEARRAANRSVDLTRQLLTFSRRQHTAPKLMDLNESVERSVGMIQRLVGEMVKIDLALAPEGCPIHGDAGQLEQVIMNLAINARDAMPRGGTLKIETSRYDADPAGARLLDLPPGDYSSLVISDSGTGMSDSVKSRIFEPFFTTKEIGRGTGLGLAVVHGVVNRHGGRIFVDSVPGEGTRFTIVLPTVVGAALDKRKASDSARPGSIPHGTGSILVVDDDPMVREVTAAMLETLGYTVFKANGAAQALDVVAKERLDLVVSDVVMPDTNGVELERRLRRERPQLKVLLVSGYARDAFERHGIGESEIQLLKKPLTLESLGTRVRELLQGNRAT